MAKYQTQNAWFQRRWSWHRNWEWRWWYGLHQINLDNSFLHFLCFDQFLFCIHPACSLKDEGVHVGEDHACRIQGSQSACASQTSSNTCFPFKWFILQMIRSLKDIVHFLLLLRSYSLLLSASTFWFNWNEAKLSFPLLIFAVVFDLGGWFGIIAYRWASLVHPQAEAVIDSIGGCKSWIL